MALLIILGVVVFVVIYGFVRDELNKEKESECNLDFREPYGRFLDELYDSTIKQEKRERDDYHHGPLYP